MIVPIRYTILTIVTVVAVVAVVDVVAVIAVVAVGAASVTSRPPSCKFQLQVSIFCTKTGQWKSCCVGDFCFAHALDMDILLFVCGVTIV